MSKVTMFWDMVDSNPTISQKLALIETNAEIVALANSLGFQFSLEDYESELESNLLLDQVPVGMAMDSGPIQCPIIWPTTSTPTKPKG